MVTTIKQRVTVEAGGRVALRLPELHEGESAQVIIMVDRPSDSTVTGADQARKVGGERVPDSNAIRHTEGVVGGYACVRNTRIPVWTLVQLKKLGRTESQLRTDYPGLNNEDLDAVWEYYRDHTDEIEQAIAAEAGED